MSNPELSITSRNMPPLPSLPTGVAPFKVSVLNNPHSINQGAETKTRVALRINLVSHQILSKLYRPINRDRAEYHKFVAKQVKTTLDLTSHFIKKEYGESTHHGIPMPQKKTFAEFVTEMQRPKVKNVTQGSRFEGLDNKIKSSVSNSIDRLKSLTLKDVANSIVNTVKLVAIASAHLGWPIYHIYFKVVEFPGRVGSVAINLGNVKEAKNNSDLKAAAELRDQLKNNPLVEIKSLEGRNIQGVCFGTVVDLFENYHQSDKTFHTFEKLSDYRNGAPATAVANQIIYESMSLTGKGKQAVVNDLKANHFPFHNNPKTDAEKKQNLKISSPFQYHVKEEIIFNQRGLNINRCPEFPHVNNRTNNNEIYDNLHKLEVGTYLVELENAGGNHAIAYIKHPDGTAHIFDPNKGAIRCYSDPNDHALQLKAAIDCYATPSTKGSQDQGKNHFIEIKKATPMTT